MSNFYIILGIQKDATQEEIKKAYRQKVKEFHPDHYRGDSAHFLAVQQAYKVLGDPLKRREYDRELCKNRQSWPYSSPVVPMDVLHRASKGHAVAPVFPDFESFFDRLWDRFSDERITTSSLQLEIPLSRRMAQRGGLFRINVPLEMTCINCHGRGSIGFYECPTCGGAGNRRISYPVSISLPGGLRDRYRIRLPLAQAGLPELDLIITFRIVNEEQG